VVFLSTPVGFVLFVLWTIAATIVFLGWLAERRRKTS